VFVSCEDGAEGNSENGEKERRGDGDNSSNSGESSENEEQEEEGRLQFPDTEIKIDYVKGNQ
jgi:hypothetical protein